MVEGRKAPFFATPTSVGDEGLLELAGQGHGLLGEGVEAVAAVARVVAVLSEALQVDGVATFLRVQGRTEVATIGIGPTQEMVVEGFLETLFAVEPMWKQDEE